MSDDGKKDAPKDGAKDGQKPLVTTTHYVKVYESILDSSVWSEPTGTRCVWLAMMVSCNRDGFVESSFSGLCRRANVTPAECREALKTLEGPDLDSKSQEWGGRRVEKVERGWQILNYAKYRDARTPTQIATAERQTEFRSRGNDSSYNVDWRSSYNGMGVDGMGGRAAGYVYYARDGEEVKIGFSRNPWARVGEMRTVRQNIAIIAIESGTRQTEVDRHKQFASSRIATTGRGKEWFRWSEDIAMHIQRLSAERDRRDSVRSDSSTTGDRSNTPSRTAIAVAVSGSSSTTTSAEPTKNGDGAEPTKLSGIKLAVAANLGLAEHPKRPQSIPRIMPGSGSTVEAVETLELAGVPQDFAESAIFEIGKGHKSDTEIRSLLYMVPGTIRRYREQQQAIEMATASRPAGLPTNERRRETAEDREAARARERTAELEKTARDNAYAKARAAAIAEWATTHPKEHSTIVDEVKKEMKDIGPMSQTTMDALVAMTCVERHQVFPPIEDWKERP